MSTTEIPEHGEGTKKTGKQGTLEVLAEKLGKPAQKSSEESANDVEKKDVEKPNESKDKPTPNNTLTEAERYKYSIEYKRDLDLQNILTEQLQFADVILSSALSSLNELYDKKIKDQYGSVIYSRPKHTQATSLLHRYHDRLAADQKKFTSSLSDSEEYVKSCNMERMKLLLLLMGTLTESKDSSKKADFKNVTMSSFFSYTFGCTEKTDKSEKTTTGLSAVKDLYMLSLLDHLTPDDMQAFFAKYSGLFKNIKEEDTQQAEENPVAEKPKKAPLVENDQAKVNVPHVSILREEGGHLGGTGDQG